MKTNSSFSLYLNFGHHVLTRFINKVNLITQNLQMLKRIMERFDKLFVDLQALLLNIGPQVSSRGQIVFRN